MINYISKRLTTPNVPPDGVVKRNYIIMCDEMISSLPVLSHGNGVAVCPS